MDIIAKSHIKQGHAVSVKTGSITSRQLGQAMEGTLHAFVIMGATDL